MSQDTNKIKLEKKIFIKGRIRLISGLRIGGSSVGLAIGDVDNPIIRNPIDGKPYIPGSSLKGKMRSLLEIKEGVIDSSKVGGVQYGPVNSKTKSPTITSLFGTGAGSTESQPSRLIVRDCHLLTSEQAFRYTELPYAELKNEVTIDRITAKAILRTMERVPANAEFSFEFVVNIFSEDNQDELLNTLFKAMELLEDDYLGGCGSRGYGQIKFIVEDAFARKSEYYSLENKTNSIEHLIDKVPEHFKNV